LPSKRKTGNARSAPRPIVELSSVSLLKSVFGFAENVIGEPRTQVFWLQRG